MNEEISSILRKSQWEDIRRKEGYIEQLFFDSFRSSAVLDSSREYSERDVEAGLRFLEGLIAIRDERLHPSFLEHSVFSSVLFRVLLTNYLEKGESSDLQSISFEEKESLLCLVQVAGLLHDAERPVIPAEYFFGNMIASAMARRLNVDRRILSVLDPVNKELGFSDVGLTIDDLTVFQRLHRIADNFGKLFDGKPLSIEEFTEYVKKQLETYSGDFSGSEESISKKPWKLTRYGLRRLRDGVAESSKSLTLSCVEWFTRQTNLTLQDVQEQALEVYTQKYRGWVNRMKEKYFRSRWSIERGLRERIGIPKIEWIIFDAGNVLIDDPGNRFWEHVKIALQELPEFDNDKMNRFNSFLSSDYKDFLISSTMNGSIESSKFLELFFNFIGYKVDPDRIKQMESLFHHQELYNEVPSMTSLVEKLHRAGGVEIAVLSDCSNFVIPPVRERIRALYPWIQKENIFFSAEILAAKRDSQTKAFEKVIQLLRIRDPRRCVFIDDRPDYVQKARDHHMRGYVFNRGISNCVPELEEYLQEMGISFRDV